MEPAELAVGLGILPVGQGCGPGLDYEPISCAKAWDGDSEVLVRFDVKLTYMPGKEEDAFLQKEK